jgi:Uma2 family endonuclease
LDLEAQSDVRHEYVAGRVFAMAGASEAHNVIALNIAARLRASLRGSGCRAFIFDLKARVELTDAFYYPDVMATCEEFDAGGLFKSRPFLIVEVLSRSTASVDRREKFAAYRQLDSLREYAVVYQDRRRAELHRKDEGGRWQTVILGEQDVLLFKSLPTEPLLMTMDDIYEDVVFSDEEGDD